MKNAAGDNYGDQYIPGELVKAGINVVSHGTILADPEIKTSFTGELLGWKFKRAWYYWCASCEKKFNDGLELKYASPLHLLIGQEVRLAGHCGCPSPEGNNFLWCEVFGEDGKLLISREKYDENIRSATAMQGHKGFDHILGDIKKEYAPIDEPIKDSPKAKRIVTSSYHIDTQEGLTIFANTLIKQHNDREQYKKDKASHDQYLKMKKQEEQEAKEK